MGSCDGASWPGAMHMHGQHPSLRQQGVRTISLEVLLLHLVNDLQECMHAVEDMCALQNALANL